MNRIRIIALITIILAICSHFFAEESLIILNKITFTGLETISSSDLIQSLNLTPKQQFESELIPVLKERMLAYFVSKGFYFVKIDNPEIVPVGDSKVDLVFNIQEGNSGYLYAIRFNGNRYFSDDKLKQLLSITEKHLIRLTDLPDLTSQVLSLYTSRGYLFAQVRLDTLSTLNNQLAAVIEINEGALFSADSYRFKGNKVTKSSTLLRISGLNQSSLITPDVLSQAENSIMLKPYIKACTIAPLDAKTLSIEVEESKMTSIEGVFGIATNPDNHKRTFTGFANVQFLNLWGTDRALALYWKKLKSDFQVLELSYHETGISKYPFAGDISFQRTKQDSAWIKMKTEVQIYYDSILNKFGTDLYTETLYPEWNDSLGIKRTVYRNVSFFWEYKKSDYPPNPTNGYIFKIKSGWIFKDTAETNKTTPVTEFDGVSFIPLKKNFVVSLGIYYREISDAKAEIYEQYKLGGFHSLRGYPEDAFSSWRLGWINAELRYLLTKDSRVYLLLDNGYLQLKKTQAKNDLWGTGIGLSFKSRVGVMSISYAFPVSAKQPISLSDGMLHLGINSEF